MARWASYNAAIAVSDPNTRTIAWFTRVCLALLVGGLALLFLWPDQPSAPRDPDPAMADSPEPGAEADAPAETRRVELKPSKATGPAPTPKPIDPRAEREQLRASILAQQARAAVATPTPAKPTAPNEQEAAPTGELNNRIGGHEPLLARLNEDFMPLASECIEAAREQDPELAGMLTVNLDVMSDEELGSIVETVDFADHNEVEHDELRTCIRETTLSMILPEAPSGREQFMLTLPLD